MPPIVFNNFGVPLAVQKPNESLLYARKCYLSNFSLGVAKHSVFGDTKKVQFLGKEKNLPANIFLLLLLELYHIDYYLFIAIIYASLHLKSLSLLASIILKP